jgi:hypothetical protein
MAVAAFAGAAPALAGDVCAPLLDGPVPGSPGARIAAIACAENRLWFSPFIDANGRLASMQVAEAESAPLDDGATPAWRRVAEYWNSSALRGRMKRFDGAADCAGPLDDRNTAASCRAFLIDTPWSAVFVSYVMARAGIDGFNPSTRHVDYVRDAYRNADDGPYRLTDPDRESLAPGDLLCFARQPQSRFGHDAFVAWLERAPQAGLDMHCDIVITTAGSRAHLIGGNVLQAVTLRMLPLNRQGRLWGVQRSSDAEASCRPGNEPACSFNRQDWVALLKLQAVQATPPPAITPCCERCTLPMPADMQRCNRTVVPESGLIRSPQDNR